MNRLKIKKISDLRLDGRIDIDNFINDEFTNGEFINSIEYLDYHPVDRFNDQSVCILDQKDSVVSVFMCTLNSNNEIVSHPGTTFSGFIFYRFTKFEIIKESIEIVIKYFEKIANLMKIYISPNYYNIDLNPFILTALNHSDFIFKVGSLNEFINLNYISSENELINNYSQSRRSKIRQLLREDNYYLDIQYNINNDAWNSLELNLMDKYQKKPTHSHQEIIDLSMRFQNKIISYTLFNKLTGEYAASSIVYRFKNVLHTQYLDLNYKYKSDSPNALLNHLIILDTLNKEINYFSFGSSTEKEASYLNEGIMNFKKSFGTKSEVSMIAVKKLRSS